MANDPSDAAFPRLACGGSLPPSGPSIAAHRRHPRASPTPLGWCHGDGGTPGLSMLTTGPGRWSGLLRGGLSGYGRDAGIAVKRARLRFRSPEGKSVRPCCCRCEATTTSTNGYPAASREMVTTACNVVVALSYYARSGCREMERASRANQSSSSPLSPRTPAVPWPQCVATAHHQPKPLRRPRVRASAKPLL